MQESLEIKSNRGGSSGPVGAVRLRVRLLGAVDVILDGRPLRAFDSPRLQRFLALIVTRKEMQSRSRLAFELWPDSTESQARTNLRKLLHEFRRALPDVDMFADIGPKSVRWLKADASTVDVLSFRDAVASGDLEHASLIYRGDLLPSCYDEWALAERESLRTEALAVHRQLAETAAERGDHFSALRHATAVSDLDFADEAAVRIELKAHHALGDRTAGLRAFRRYAEGIRDELAIDPSAEIVALCRELFADPPDRERQVSPRSGITGASKFVGRVPEWRKLAETWLQARSGRSHLVLLTGESGIGKTRLAQEFGLHLKAHGHEVATARAYEAAGRLPWGPVIDLLRTTGIKRRLQALDEPWIAEIARLLPELRGTIPQPPNGSSTQVARRHRLFDAVCAAIAAHDGAQMIIIDDLQWCDVETIEFIGYFLRSHPQTPIMIVGTVRWEELTDGQPLPGIVDALRRDQAVTTIAIRPLDKASTAALAATMRGPDEIDAGLAARLWNETEGNPLFIVEAMQGGFSAESEQGVLTPTIRSVLRARLDQLTDSGRQLAEVAAIFGRSFSARALESVMGADEAVADLLDELWRRRILIDRGRMYDFSHDKLREVAIELINPARRRRLHRMVAEALAHEHGSDPATSAQLAAHYDQAGMAKEAIEAYRIAGARAVAMSGLKDAVALFRRALELLAELAASPERDAVELDIRIALGSPLVAVEGYGSDASHRLYERALSLCGKVGIPVAPPILRGLGLAHLQGCRFDHSTNYAKALIDHECDDHVSGTEGRYLMGVSAFWQGDLDMSLRFLESAIEHYDPTRREEHLARYAQDPKAVCLVRLGLSRLWNGDPAEADLLARSAQELAEKIDHPMTLAYVVTYSAILATAADDFRRLEQLLRQTDSIWSRLSERYFKIVLNAIRGWLEVHEGSPTGIDRIVQSTAPSRVEGETLHLTMVLLLLARARARRGELQEARAAAREAIAWSEQCGQRYLMPELLRVNGEAAYGLGEAEAAFASLHRAVEVSRAQGARWLTLKALFSLASRFPGPGPRAQLSELADDLPSGHDWPAFRAASSFLHGAG